MTDPRSADERLNFRIEDGKVIWDKGGRPSPATARERALWFELQRFRKLDAEASEHVESVICMRTNFTGHPPYVGWKGLGLALTEALDERDRLRKAKP